jgi:hypothetical protein
MQVFLRVVILGLAGMALWIEPAAAQMFGSRRLGGTLGRRPAPGDATGGTLTGVERFIRANRRRTDFVGPDTFEQQFFVGGVGGRVSGPVRSAVEGLRIERGPAGAQSAPSGAARPTGISAPRLQVAFPVTETRAEDLQARLTEQLERSPSLGEGGTIEVLVSGRTAILRGEVVSEQDAVLAELLVGMEPGISEVRNELRWTPLRP